MEAYESECPVDLCSDGGAKPPEYWLLSALNNRPPAILCMHPSFRGDCLLVSGLLLSSALCQVKNNVMPWRAVCLSLSFCKASALLN